MADSLAPFREGLRERGYVENRNCQLEVRWSEGRNERLPTLATELVRLKVDVIVTHGIPAARATQAATRSIPIVIASAADLVGAGIVASLSRPGGNVTGVNDQTTELSAKEVEVLRDVLPAVKHVAVLWNRANPGAVSTAKALQTAARNTGLRVTLLDIDRADDIGAALTSAVKERVEAVIVAHDTMTIGNRQHIARLALAKRLPSISASTLFVEAGGLVSYGPDRVQLFRGAAGFVDKILKGAKPGDLPVEQHKKLELVINLKTAKALGLTIPPSLLLRADQVIE